MNGSVSGNPLEQCDVNINIPNECFIFEWRIFRFQVSSVSGRVVQSSTEWAARNTMIDFRGSERP